MNTASFPGLGIGAFTLHSVAFKIGPVSVHWYAICIVIGMILAFLFCERKAKIFGVSDDDFLDLVLFGVPFGLIGARVGYILMDLKSFSSFQEMISVWNGGLSIYGGIIAAFITLIIACKIKKINIFGVLDLAVLGIMIGQIVGRWGNFFNFEVYGVQTNLPWRMGIGINGIVSEYVHPLFLYESLWNLVGFVLILAFLDQRKFKGEVFLWYSAWYGLGRGVMESMRNSDFQLTVGSAKINQVIAFSALILSLVAWIYFRFVKISVHFDASDIDKNLSFIELKNLHRKKNFEKETAKYDRQFTEQLEEEAAVSEDEYAMKQLMDKIEENLKEYKETKEEENGSNH